MTRWAIWAEVCYTAAAGVAVGGLVALVKAVIG